MKAKLLLLICILLQCMNLCSQVLEKPYYYYYKGEKQFLDLNSRYVLISSTNDTNADFFSYATKHLNKVGDISFDEIKLELIPGFDYNEKLKKLKGISGVKVSPYFKNDGCDKIGLSDYFYVKLKEESDSTMLKQYSESRGIEIVSRNMFMPKWYTLSTRPLSNSNAMECANIFYESRLFEYATPDFVTEDVLSLSDPFYKDQWGLNNTGQYNGIVGIDIEVENAWKQFITGTDINVAVLDHGIQLDHPDLISGIYPQSYDTETNSYSVIRGNHGTACAGIIGARSNGEGVSGVAPDCRLISISNSLQGALSREKRANGFNWAINAGADVISNSWGAGDTPIELLDDAIHNATTVGREGLGCVIVFSSGNNNKPVVEYPASLDEVIAVGAMSMCGERKSPTSCDSEYWWGSNYGDALDVVAPGVKISTTDRTGIQGYNAGNSQGKDYDNLDYTKNFNGTSAACPHVAGVAALVLDANPLLTSNQVRSIINSTCTKLSNYTYSSTTDHPDGNWNNEVGHGLVNANKAVLAAKDVLPEIGNVRIIRHPTAYSITLLYEITGVGIPQNYSVDWSISHTPMDYIKSYTFSETAMNEYKLAVSSTYNAIPAFLLTGEIYNSRREKLHTMNYHFKGISVGGRFSLANGVVDNILTIRQNRNDKVETNNLYQNNITNCFKVNIYSNSTKVMSCDVNSIDDINIDVSNLPNGNYIVNVADNVEVVLSNSFIVRH